MGAAASERHTLVALQRGIAEDTGRREARGGHCLSLTIREGGSSEGALESASSLKPSLVSCPPSSLSPCPVHRLHKTS